MNWYLEVLKKYAVFSGRARRKEYWMFVLFNTIFVIVASVLDTVVFGFPLEEFGPLYVIYGLAVFIPSLAVMVRRLHDTGRSGWFALISAIPIVSLWVLYILCTDGDLVENKYGPNPKQVNTEQYAYQEVTSA